MGSLGRPNKECVMCGNIFDKNEWHSCPECGYAVPKNRSRPRDYLSDLEDGKKWESGLNVVLRYILSSEIVEACMVREATGKEQLDGMDSRISCDITSEVKTRAHCYYLSGILIEEKHVDECGNITPGWGITTKADVLIYVWKNVDNTCLMPIYYLIRLCGSKYREFIRTQLSGCDSLPPSSSVNRKTGRKWRTYNRIVKPSEFPEGVLFKKEFSQDQLERIREYMGHKGLRGR